MSLASAIRSQKAIFIQLSDSTDQKPTVTTPVAITLDSESDKVGITHSTTVNSEEITIDRTGLYGIIAGAQVQRTTSGGANKIWHMFMQKDTGSGFVDIPKSNIEESLASLDELVSPLNMLIPLVVGDKIRFMQSVSETGQGVGIAAKVPSGEPEVPSIIISIRRGGDT